MNGLFPIIRRLRRPLIVDAAPAVVVDHVEPALPVAALPMMEPLEPPKSSDAKASPKRKAQ